MSTTPVSSPLNSSLHASAPASSSIADKTAAKVNTVAKKGFFSRIAEFFAGPKKRETPVASPTPLKTKKELEADLQEFSKAQSESEYYFTPRGVQVDKDVLQKKQEIARKKQEEAERNDPDLQEHNARLNPWPRELLPNGQQPTTSKSQDGGRPYVMSASTQNAYARVVANAKGVSSDLNLSDQIIF